LGAAAATDVDVGPGSMHESDVATYEHLGHRVASVTGQLLAGRNAETVPGKR
jgi:hypothetical protein